METKEIIDYMLNSMDTFNMDDLPNIDLYMDQVTTYLNNKFKNTKRKEDDKLLTKTMVNNYAKSRLLPPPEKKKYTKDHLIVLTMIMFFKNVISINDMSIVFKPVLDKYFHNEEKNLEDLFLTYLSYVKDTGDYNQIISTYEKSKLCFNDADVEDKEYLQTLALIAMLTYECFSRKIIIEKLIDSLPKETEEADNKTKTTPEQN